MVFQNFNLFPHMTALENVMLAPRRVLKKSQAECRSWRSGCWRVGLGDRLDYYPANLSGGQQQRVAIAWRWPCRRKFCSVTKISPRRLTRNWWVKC